jgi:two-component system, NarL family, response regulator DegU
MNQTISVIVAEDHPVFRKGLRDAIEDDRTLQLVAEAGDGEVALRLIEEHLPDVALLDIDMPGMNGLQVARSIQERNLFVATVILTIYKEEDMFNEAMDAGVRGYVLKETAIVDLLEAIKAVTMGEYYFSPTIAGYLVNRSKRAKDLLEQKPSMQHLTQSERRILKLIAVNKTSKEIADELSISYRTVETHRTNIATKLNLHGPHSLLKFAIHNKSSLG